MRRYLGVGLAWLGATAVSVLIASAAVAGIRDRVVEAPVAIGLPTSTTTTPTAVGDTTATVAVEMPAASTTIAVPETTTTTVPTREATTTTTTKAPTESTPTTTAAPSTTTTTAPPATTTSPVAYSTHDLIGGTVVLAFGDGQVNLVSATPRAGFSVDPEHTGPKEVEVKFVGNDHKSKLEAHVDGGELRVDIEEEPHDDDDD